MTNNETKLINIATRIAMLVCNGQSVTRSEADAHDALRRAVGRDWDAINQCWKSLGAD